MQIRRSAQHQIVPWANGLGVTAVVGVGPGDPWTWRLSIADVADDGPFSNLPGIDRHILVAEGVGMDLTVGKASPQRVTYGSDPLSFSGDSPTLCRLIDGPISDLNLMVRRAVAAGALLAVRLRHGQSLRDHDLAGSYPAVAVVVLQGSVLVAFELLDRFDAVLVEPGELLPTVTAETDCLLTIVCVRS